MALIGKSRGRSRHGWKLTGQHQPLGVAQAKLSLVEIWAAGLSSAGRRGADGSGHAGESRKLGQRNILGKFSAR